MTPSNTPAPPTKTTQLAPDLPIWRLSVDRAANSQGSGAGLILTSLDRIDVEYALEFEFQASNNEPEYEAVIVGVNLTHSMEAAQLEICSDSQMVVKHIEGSYEARGEKMVLYLKTVREILKKFIRDSGQACPKGREYMGRCLGQASNSAIGGSRQIGTGRAPPRTLGEH